MNWSLVTYNFNWCVVCMLYCRNFNYGVHNMTVQLLIYIFKNVILLCPTILALSQTPLILKDNLLPGHIKKCSILHLGI